VDFLYSLYDALVSINVPSDKARAVVDAMERDMSTTLATKQDLAFLRQELSGVQSELKHEISTQTLRMTIRLGSMLFLGLGLTIAVLRLWSG